ncbi:hypothetical protein QMK19_15095 [Streptomyces sp. H10-C2]|nr:hypothetical protein [Streptomyces sp. PH10-H1]MDJ0370975.1 hypothetical protein [Streptomyces sp. H10-C2]
MFAPEAYADAPPIIREMNTVLTLVEALRIVATPERIRELQLRKAALLDRIALHTPQDTDAADVATDAADALFVLDCPDPDERAEFLDQATRHRYWRDGLRGYVRTQYAAYSHGPNPA